MNASNMDLTSPHSIPLLVFPTTLQFSIIQPTDRFVFVGRTNSEILLKLAQT